MLIIKSYFKFIFNPKESYFSSQKPNKVITFFTVLIITYTLLFIVSYIHLPDSKTTINQLTLSLQSIPYILLIIPIYEEVIFRLGLKLSKARISLSISLFISSLIIVLSDTLFDIYKDLSNFYLYSTILAIPIFLIIRKIYNKNIKQILSKYFPYVFFISMLSFVMMHFLYSEFSIAAFLTYFIYSYSLSFLRIASNFISSVLLHYILILPLLINYLT